MAKIRYNTVWTFPLSFSLSSRVIGVIHTVLFGILLPFLAIKSDLLLVSLWVDFFFLVRIHVCKSPIFFTSLPESILNMLIFKLSIFSKGEKSTSNCGSTRLICTMDIFWSTSFFHMETPEWSGSSSCIAWRAWGNIITPCAECTGKGTAAQRSVQPRPCSCSEAIASGNRKPAGQELRAGCSVQARLLLGYDLAAPGSCAWGVQAGTRQPMQYLMWKGPPLSECNISEIFYMLYINAWFNTRLCKFISHTICHQKGFSLLYLKVLCYSKSYCYHHSTHRAAEREME